MERLAVEPEGDAVCLDLGHRAAGGLAAELHGFGAAIAVAQDGAAVVGAARDGDERQRREVERVAGGGDAAGLLLALGEVGLLRVSRTATPRE